MKLGVSYNIFDGEELLEASILSIKNNVDYINVVYQTTSNHGKYYNNTTTLNALKKEGLIDTLIFYNPNKRINPKQNETIKRNIGLQDCRTHNCTHHLTLDTDEFFHDNEFKNSKAEIIKNDYDVTLCNSVYYYKYPECQIPSITCVIVFIIKIYVDKYSNIKKYPRNVDPSRRYPIKNDNFVFFNEQQLLMHHYSYVRKDITKKINNVSSKFLFDVNKSINFYNNYKKDNVVLLHRNGKTIQSPVKIVDNYFNIKI